MIWPRCPRARYWRSPSGRRLSARRERWLRDDSRRKSDQQAHHDKTESRFMAVTIDLTNPIWRRAGFRVVGACSSLCRNEDRAAHVVVPDAGHVFTSRNWV